MTSTEYSITRKQWKCTDCDDEQLVIGNSILPYANLEITSLTTEDDEQISTASFTEASKSNFPEIFTTAKGMKICHINCNSIRNKFEDIQILLQQPNVGVLACTESKLDPYRDTVNQFKVNNYSDIRIDNTESRGGGTIVYINSNLYYDVIENTDSKLPKSCECLTIRLYKDHLKPIYVTVIYRHPNSNLNLFNDFFTSLLVNLTTTSNNNIILGDFNINLLKNTNNATFDKNIHQHFLTCKEFNLWQLMTGPTHTNNSLLDHIYVDNKKYQELNCYGHFPYAGSDHDLCFITIKSRKIKFQPKMISYRNLKSIDPKKFSEDLLTFDLNSLDPLTSSNITCDNNFRLFNSHVMSTLDKHAPKKRRLVKGKVTPWYSSEVSQLTKKLNKELLLHRKDSSNLITNYRTTRRQRNALLLYNKKLHFKKLSNEVETSENLWSTIDKITNFRLPTKTQIHAIENNNIKITDKNEINSLFAKEFVIEADENHQLESIKQKINDYNVNYDYTNSSDCDKYPIRIEHEEIKTTIKTLKNSNNPLYPPTSIIKCFSQVFIVFLCSLFTQFINSCKIPTSFKSATIHPVFKNKGSRLSTKNYRPISILTDYCKLFEKFIAHRLNTRVDNMISEKQHAYRKNYSCNTALKELTNSIFKCIDKPKGKTVAVFIDLKKAFDSVNHSILINKLMDEYKVEPWYINILHEIYTNRTFKIVNSDDYYPFPNGICQGSALSSLLFSLFINSIGEKLTCEYLMYADDLVIFSHGTNCDEIVKVIIENMKMIAEWCTKNYVEINYDKTEFMIFHKEHDRSINEEDIKQISINNHIIKRVYKFKYLGIILDPSLTYNYHFDSVLNKVTHKIKFIHGIKRLISPKILTTLISAYIHSITDFAIEIWAVVSKAKLNLLQKKIDSLLLCYFFPSLARKKRKLRNFLI